MKLSVYNIEGKSVGREVELSADVFGLEMTDQLNHVVYLAVKQYLANQRQGTHKAKQRNEIAGSTRKLHRQKGTGGSRKGSIKNPLYHGGGRIFGPQPRSYEQRLNKKVKALARKAVLSSKALEGRIIVIEDFKWDAPKTKNYVNLLNSIPAGEGKLADVKSLLVLKAPSAPTMPVKMRYPRKVRGSKKRNQYQEIVQQYISSLEGYKKALATYEQEQAAYEAQLAATYNNIQISSRNIPNAATARASMLNTYDIINTQYLVLSESALQQLTLALS
jgi:large subunit ribosomal protein L4